MKKVEMIQYTTRKIEAELDPQVNKECLERVKEKEYGREDSTTEIKINANPEKETCY